MAIPLSQLPPDLIWNGQLDVSNPVKQAKYNQLNDAWNQNQGQDPGQRAEETLLQAQQKLQEETNRLFKEYNTKNPFMYDQVLADKAAQAKEQVDPYYNETLTNYLTGVSNKISRSKQDTQDLLGELSATTESYTGQLKNRLNEAINSAAQGKADAGLFDSGARYREGGQLTNSANEDLTDFNRQQAYKTNLANTGLERTLTDTGLAKTQDVRNLERDRATDINTTAAQLAREQGQSYVSGFYNTLPPALQANTGMDLLKQIGIY